MQYQLPLNASDIAIYHHLSLFIAFFLLRIRKAQKITLFCAGYLGTNLMNGKPCELEDHIYLNMSAHGSYLLLMYIFQLVFN